MDKRFLGILAAIVIIFIGIFAISQNSGSNNTSGSKNKTSSNTTNHVEGQGKSGITLTEYGDYECPICGEYYLPLKQAVAQYSSQIFFRFANLPLTQIHQNAFAAARAAEAAGQQNKFWQMHDKLYENQNQWTASPNPLDIFSQYAQAIGINVDQFKQDYSSSKVNDAINADLAAFGKTGQQQATPTFFVNGKYLANTSLVDPQTGAPTAASISAAIKAQIDKKSGSGTSQ